MEKKISVVIPTYKRPHLLIRCLRALADQTLSKSDFEVIVVSDGLDEETNFAIRFESDLSGLDLRHVCLPEKKGPAAARNMGWLLGKGHFIAFTDDDCIPDKDWLKVIGDSWHEAEEIAFSGKTHVPLPKNPTDYEKNISNLETAEFITANCVLTKKALIKVGGFDERFSLAWREDSDLHFKLLMNRIPVFKINALVVHPVRNAPWGVSLKEEKKGMFNALLYKKFPELYEHKIKAKAPWNYYAMIIALIAAVFFAVAGLNFFANSSLAIWAILLMWFISKRLSATSHSSSHVAEMIITSILIPFLSVYWQLYGALKFRVFFI